MLQLAREKILLIKYCW